MQYLLIAKKILLVTVFTSYAMTLLACADNDQPPSIKLSGPINVREGTAQIDLKDFASNSNGDSISYFLVGGLDASLFTLDRISGIISFNSVPDFEHPIDANSDNTYEIIITLSNGEADSTTAVELTVFDDFEIGVVRLPGRLGVRGFSGQRVSGAGDVDGDGQADILIGDSSAREAYLVFGSALTRAQDGVLPLSDLSSQSTGIRFLGLPDGSLSYVKDIDGDGADEILLGAPRNSREREAQSGSAIPGVIIDPLEQVGESYLFFSSFLAMNKGGVFTVDDVPALTGLKFTGPEEGARAGAAVAGYTDYNEDGIVDLIVASPPFNSEIGVLSRVIPTRVYVISGKAAVDDLDATVDLEDFPDLTKGVVVNGVFEDSLNNTKLGRALTITDDIDGDDLPDIMLSATFGPDDEGAIILFSSALKANMTGEIYDNEIAAAGQGVYLRNIATLDSIRSVSSAGDVDSDGLIDVMIGAENADFNGRVDSGAIYLIFGAAVKADADSVIDMTTIASDGAGAILTGVGAGDRAGLSISEIGDIDSDGYDEILIGALSANPNGVNGGEAYVISGAAITNDADGLINLDDVGESVRGVRIWPRGPSNFGVSVDVAGDVNLDNLPDIVIGANTLRTNNSFGETYVISGRLLLEEMQNGDGVINLADIFP